MPLDADLHTYLNAHYGTQTVGYKTLSRLLKLGVEEQWAAYVEIEGPDYRRGRISEPARETADMSVESGLLRDVKGQYHCHTNGEINMIISLEPGANFCGTGAGWRVFPPLSEHFPTVQGRALMLFSCWVGESNIKHRHGDVAERDRVCKFQSPLLVNDNQQNGLGGSGRGLFNVS
jgi:2-hydroxylaminobenzoate mutase